MGEVQIIAGSIAGLIFAAASWNMLVKAWSTKDLRSYSLGQIVLNNVGNLFYWLYVASLPFGPIWLMHTFFTLTSLLMLVWYFIYWKAPATQTPIRDQSQANSGQSCAVLKRMLANHDLVRRFRSAGTKMPARASSFDLLAKPCQTHFVTDRRG